MTYELELTGPIPSKKNLYRRGHSGQMFLNADVKAQIDALTWQAKRKWGRKPPLVHPDMDIEFFVLNRKADRDNKLGCLLDVLQEAGIISKDNVAQFNGCILIKPAVVGTKEGVALTMTEFQASLIGGAA